MLTVLSLKKARESRSLWESLTECTALHITDRIDELRPEDFSGLGHIEHLIVGPQLEEIHSENTGFRTPRRTSGNNVIVPEFLFRELRSLRHLEIKMKGITELPRYAFADFRISNI